MKGGIMKLKDQVAIVTGGARGNGLAIAKALAGEGCNVVIADICADMESVPYPLANPDDLDAAVKAVEAMGVKAVGIKCDIRSSAEVGALVDKVLADFGKVDILINNAGVTSLVPVADMDELTWDETLDSHLKGTFLCCHFVVPHMIDAHSGKIVSISSVGGQRGFGMGSHYCAAKHGIIGFSKSLAMETADHNINVNVVCPGTIWTKMMSGLAEYFGMDQDEAKVDFMKGHLFKDREITSDDIGQAVLWLCLPESKCVTGNMITVDAGWTCQAP
jgi:NAD(P)-dependent dehydrogenase (short-subunit alcohol dehydrogenase family)